MTTLTTLPNSQDSDAQLASAARLLRAAIGLFSDDRDSTPAFAEMADFEEVLTVVQERIKTWLKDERNDDDERATDLYTVLDICNVVSTLVAAGLTSESIKGTLEVAAGIFESVLEAESELADPDDQAVSAEREARVAEAA